jgi:hypothetical protein
MKICSGQCLAPSGTYNFCPDWLDKKQMGDSPSVTSARLARKLLKRVDPRDKTKKSTYGTTYVVYLDVPITGTAGVWNIHYQFRKTYTVQFCLYTQKYVFT